MLLIAENCIATHLYPFIILIGQGTCANDMCCECYPGDRPFSEEESSNVATYLEGRSSELRAFLDIHSYSQLMVSPWGWTNEVPQEYRQMVSGVLSTYIKCNSLLLCMPQSFSRSNQLPSQTRSLPSFCFD